MVKSALRIQNAKILFVSFAPFVVENKMDFTFAIALGLLGSLHCAAMCGPLQLALPIPPGGAGRVILGRVIYQLGRVMTYALLGALGGCLGKSFFLIGLQNSLSIALGVAVLGGFLISKRVAISAPVARLVGTLKLAMSAQLRRRGFRALAVLGMLNGLLPCGLVYVALAGAVARGNVWSGIGYMTAFGLGTSPMLLAISLSGKMFPPALRLKLNRLIPFGICLLAILLILRGLSLGIPFVSPNLAAGANCCATN
jgi:sulfite exporter TauE/SafE